MWASTLSPKNNRVAVAQLVEQLSTNPRVSDLIPDSLTCTVSPRGLIMYVIIVLKTFFIADTFGKLILHSFCVGSLLKGK